MDFLNANSTECSVVLFFTAWCQFSARLAPHFNALPRTFPSMHFLALDASQHSRYLLKLTYLYFIFFVAFKKKHFLHFIVAKVFRTHM